MTRDLPRPWNDYVAPEFASALGVRNALERPGLCFKGSQPKRRLHWRAAVFPNTAVRNKSHGPNGF